VDNFIRFAEEITNVNAPFQPSATMDIASLDASIRSGEITLQARANAPTPIFYTEGICNIFGGATGTDLFLNEENHIHPLEMIALPGTTFHIVGAHLDNGNIIYQVTTPDYPYETEK
jgi:hypothetical protein